MNQCEADAVAVTGNKVTGKEVTHKEGTGKEVTGKKVTGKEVTGMEVTGREKVADPDTSVVSDESDSDDDIPLVELEAIRKKKRKLERRERILKEAAAEDDFKENREVNLKKEKSASKQQFQNSHHTVAYQASPWMSHQVLGGPQVPINYPHPYMIPYNFPPFPQMSAVQNPFSDFSSPGYLHIAPYQWPGGLNQQLAVGLNQPLTMGHNQQIFGGHIQPLTGNPILQMTGQIQPMMGSNIQPMTGVAGGYNLQKAGGDNLQMAGGPNLRMAGSHKL